MVRRVFGHSCEAWKFYTEARQSPLFQQLQKKARDKYVKECLNLGNRVLKLRIDPVTLLRRAEQFVEQLEREYA